MQQLRHVEEKTSLDPKPTRESQPLEETYYPAEEDEISLLDYLIVLLKHKKLIIGMVLVAGLAGLIRTVILSETKLYRSHAIIVPQQGGIASFGLSGRGYRQPQYSAGTSSSGKLLMMLNSRGLTAKVIEKNNLMPVLFSGSWDKKDKKWKGDPPTLHSACEMMQGFLRAGPAEGKKGRNRSYSGGQMPISVGIRYRHPEAAKEFVDDYLTELSGTLRNEALRDATEKKRFLEKQLDTVIDPFMKEKIHILRANEVEKETFAKAQKYYGFTVMDPPVVPDRLSAEKPKLKRNIVLAMTVAFFLAVFLAFIIEYVRRIKTEDTERYQDLIRELKTWRSSKSKG